MPRATTNVPAGCRLDSAKAPPARSLSTMAALAPILRTNDKPLLADNLLFAIFAAR